MVHMSSQYFTDFAVCIYCHHRTLTVETRGRGPRIGRPHDRSIGRDLCQRRSSVPVARDAEAHWSVDGPRSSGEADRWIPLESADDVGESGRSR